MRRIFYFRSVRIAALTLVVLATVAAGPCSSKQQPASVADTLVTLGNIKRELRAQNEISPQADYDISARLLAANRAYRRFIDDELLRLESTGATEPNPDSRRQAIDSLLASLRGLRDPVVLGIKSERGQRLWREGLSTMSTIISGLETLRGGS